MIARRHALVLVGLLGGCADKPVDPAPVAVEPAPAKVEPPAKSVEAAPAPELKRAPVVDPSCVIDAATGEPWTELIPSIPALSSFACPAKLRVVQRRPWYGPAFNPNRIAAPSRRDIEGEILAITGRDPATGDAAWATVVHAPGHPSISPSLWFARTFSPACGVGEIAPGWYCLGESSRSGGGAEPLREWLAGHPEIEAVDWIALDTWKHLHRLDTIDWTKQPRALVLRERDGLNVCWFAGSAKRCWTLAGVAGSEIIEVGSELVLDVEIEDGKTRWALKSDGTWAAAGEPSGWQPIEVTTPERDHAELARLYPAEVIRTRGDGVVLGRYVELGGAGVREVTMATWILSRHDAQWVATAVPDLVVHDLVTAGSSLGVIASWFLIGDGPTNERRELLTFTPRDGALEFVGQLEAPVAMIVVGETANYKWQHEIVAAGPDCLSLRAGRAAGEIYDDEGVARPITKQLRERLATLAGTWRITPDGPRRGC